VWDANLLVHARRSGILPEPYRPRIFNTRTPHSFPTFLVDGAVAGILTFLIADIRGYTHFTQQRGDEAAARLTRKFAEIVLEGVEAHDGSVPHLRGDEALAVFGSARQAIRSAVELAVTLADETRREPDLPLTVGIGLDAGEAVRVTNFESPGRMIPPRIVTMELSLAADRLVLPIMEVSGSIWILENVNR